MGVRRRRYGSGSKSRLGCGFAGEAEILTGARVVGAETECGFVERDGLAGLAGEEEDVGEVCVGVGIGGRKAEHRAEMGSGGREAFGAGVEQAESAVRGEVVRREAEDGGVITLGVGELAGLLGEAAELVVRVGEARIEGEGGAQVPRGIGRTTSVDEREG